MIVYPKYFVICSTYTFISLFLLVFWFTKKRDQTTQSMPGKGMDAASAELFSVTLVNSNLINKVFQKNSPISLARKFKSVDPAWLSFFASYSITVIALMEKNKKLSSSGKYNKMKQRSYAYLKYKDDKVMQNLVSQHVTLKNLERSPLIQGTTELFKYECERLRLENIDNAESVGIEIFEFFKIKKGYDFFPIYKYLGGMEKMEIKRDIVKVSNLFKPALNKALKKARRCIL